MPVSSYGFGYVVVIQFADPSREVTGTAKRMWQAELLGNRLPENLAVLQDARAVRIKSRQHRVATRPAQWELAVAPLEPHTAIRQAVDVWRFDLRMPIAAKRVIQIVRNDEQHVGTRFGRFNLFHSKASELDGNKCDKRISKKRSETEMV